MDAAQKIAPEQYQATLEQVETGLDRLRRAFAVWISYRFVAAHDSNPIAEAARIDRFITGERETEGAQPPPDTIRRAG